MSIRELPHTHTHLKPLIEFVIREGWKVSIAPGGQLIFEKAGLPTIFTGSVIVPKNSHRNSSSQVHRRDAVCLGGCDG